jgi:tetratricopeptide (TPR) repeat protein
MDADETLIPSAGFQWGALDADLYSITVLSDTVEFERNCVVSSALPWRWEGVLHEYLEVDQPFRSGRIEGIDIHRYFDGARGQDPHKYENDARLLEAALCAEPGNTRYAFYLAQSWRDCGQIDKALAAYAQRATMGGWDEEVWYARYQLAILAEGLQRPRAEVVDLYLAAFQARPSRVEPLVHLARYLRSLGDYHLAHAFAARARDIADPPDLLFIEKPCYGWWRDDEYAVACSWTGRHEQARAGFAALLQAPDLPASERKRTQANLKFSESRLAALSALKQAD